jgi:hypothetical protein
MVLQLVTGTEVGLTFDEREEVVAELVVLAEVAVEGSKRELLEGQARWYFSIWASTGGVVAISIERTGRCTPCRG